MAPSAGCCQCHPLCQDPAAVATGTKGMMATVPRSCPWPLAQGARGFRAGCWGSSLWEGAAFVPRAGGSRAAARGWQGVGGQGGQCRERHSGEGARPSPACANTGYRAAAGTGPVTPTGERGLPARLLPAPSPGRTGSSTRSPRGRGLGAARRLVAGWLPAPVLPGPGETLKRVPGMAEPTFTLLGGENRVGDRLPWGAGLGRAGPPGSLWSFRPPRCCGHAGGSLRGGALGQRRVGVSVPWRTSSPLLHWHVGTRCAPQAGGQRRPGEPAAAAVTVARGRRERVTEPSAVLGNPHGLIRAPQPRRPHGTRAPPPPARPLPGGRGSAGCPVWLPQGMGTPAPTVPPDSKCGTAGLGGGSGQCRGAQGGRSPQPRRDQTPRRVQLRQGGVCAHRSYLRWAGGGATGGALTCLSTSCTPAGLGEQAAVCRGGG